ncbi:MAG: hypothetical protein U0354_09250 [Candidatus Sericytochromatia bacterium]
MGDMSIAGKVVNLPESKVVKNSNPITQNNNNVNTGDNNQKTISTLPILNVQFNLTNTSTVSTTSIEFPTKSNSQSLNQFNTLSPKLNQRFEEEQNLTLKDRFEDFVGNLSTEEKAVGAILGIAATQKVELNIKF